MPFQMIRNDLTRMQVDAIVNPTDAGFSGSGGTDRMIHSVAGPELRAACDQLPALLAGEVVITPGFHLSSPWIIHTVGPVWQGGDHGEAEALAECYRAALALAAERKLASVAFPVIASGSFGFPREQAQEIALREIRAFLETEDLDITLVVYDPESFRISRSLYWDIQSFIDDCYLADRSRSVSLDPLERQSVFGDGTLEDFPMSAPTSCEAAEPDAASARKQAAKPKRKKSSILAPHPKTPRPDTNRKMTGGLNLADWVKGRQDESFAQMLLRKIDESGMKDSECYKRANVDRKLFSKIRSDPTYRPSKTTALAFAIALRLDLEQTRELLEKAGFALSRYILTDVIVEYFITQGNYDIYEINEALFEFDQALLGAKQ